MIKIKLCGMFRDEDIQYANEAAPDYIGFILNYPKSHRNISLDTAKRLRSMLSDKIKTVGVFVDAPPKYILEALRQGIIDMVQLHGNEDEDYIKLLKKAAGRVEVIKAVKVRSAEDIRDTCADFLLLDNGKGTGQQFNHTLIDRERLTKPFFLAGGITPENIAEAAELLPYAVDMSGGIETDSVKDKKKMLAAVNIIRNIR